MARSPDWTDQENDRIVESYFTMLKAEMAGTSYVKASHNQRLQDSLGRTKGAIEYKFQNLSALLQVSGEIWIPGYKPAKNFQKSLRDAVERWQANNPEYLSRPRSTRIRDGAALWMAEAPPLGTKPSPRELDMALPVARKFDVAGRDARNRQLGLAGEKLVLDYERNKLKRAGRPDLASLVKWASKEEGDGLGYDIASYFPDGRQQLIEVKTTDGYEWTRFYISPNELRVSQERRDEWRLCRVWDFWREPKAFELAPPLEARVDLTPSSFIATLK